MSKDETACIDDSIYCKLPEPLDGYGGYKPDILVDNLTEREINLFLCKICHGIKREACFQEHENRPDLLVNTRGISQEIGNIKVCCPLYQCKWEGKICEFHTPIHNCAGSTIRKIAPVDINTVRKVFYLSIFLNWIMCSIFLCLGFAIFTINFYSLSIHSNHTEVFGKINSELIKKIDNFTKYTLISFSNALDNQANEWNLQGMRLARVELELISVQGKIIEFGKSMTKSKDYSKLMANFNQSFSNLLESNLNIRHNPYLPQKGVIWNIYQVNEILEKPTEDSGPEFYINEYKFQPSIETLRDNEACITFCISLVNCNHYDKIKWPMELEDKAFKVFLQTQKKPSETLYFEVNEDNKFYFDKPRNEKNKPLCRQWICKKELNKYIENDGLIVYIRNTEVKSETLE